MIIHAERREPSVGRGTESTSGDGDCPGGNPRARRRPTDMEAGTGWRGGADGRTGIRTQSISVRYPEPGKTAGAHGGGPRDMVEEAGRPVTGARHATQPPAGTAAGGRANTVVAYTIPPHGVTVDNNNTRLGGGQDNGESSDVAQKHGMTPGTASAVFPRLGYAMADGTNITRQPGQANNKSESKASTLSRQDPNQQQIEMFLINRGNGPTYTSCVRMERFAKWCARARA